MPLMLSYMRSRWLTSSSHFENYLRKTPACMKHIVNTWRLITSNTFSLKCLKSMAADHVIFRLQWAMTWSTKSFLKQRLAELILILEQGLKSFWISMWSWWYGQKMVKSKKPEACISNTQSKFSFLEITSRTLCA